MRMYITVLLVILASTSYAQEKLEGHIWEADTRIALQGVKVTNLTSRDAVQSDSSGTFSIRAKKGDLIGFSSFAYVADTLFLTNLKPRDVFMHLKTQTLSEVTLKPNAIALNLKEPHPYLHNQPVIYQMNKDGSFKGGIALRIFHGKDSKKERQAMKRMKDAEAMEAIDRIFNPQNIGKFIPLEGEELRNFIGLYRPTVPVFSSSSFNLLLYLNDHYKKYKLLPPDKRRLPPLPKFVP